MSELKFENRPFEKLNFDFWIFDFPTLRETFSLKNEAKIKILAIILCFCTLQRLNSFSREFCTPLRDFRVVKKVPLSLVHTRDPNPLKILISDLGLKPPFQRHLKFRYKHKKIKFSCVTIVVRCFIEILLNFHSRKTQFV